MEWDKKRPPNSIVLSFSLGERANDVQIVQAVEPYPGKWMHHVIIQHTSDLNESLKQRLREAYKLAS